MPSVTERVRLFPALTTVRATRSPGLRAAMTFASCCPASMRVPATFTIVSPWSTVLAPLPVVRTRIAWSPAFAAGLPLSTRATTTPWEGRLRTALARPGSIVSTWAPRNACSTCPVAINWSATDLAVSLEIAKPIPMLPPFALLLAICSLTPTTRPSRSSSGPPELP